ncbi:MAG: VOC family protein [Alphaproteobacteria bacterium]|nr:VOC family protein [Alphaproteobacteria bacterium]
MAKLRHFALSVPDPEAAAAFYEKAFGLERVGASDHPGATGVYLSDGVINLALLRYKTDEAAGEDRGKDYFGVHHFGFLVDDVDDTTSRIKDAGGTYLSGDVSQTGGFYEIKFRDPNGVIVDITENGWVTGPADD